MKADVVVIGSGLGGLEAAALLAKRRLHVVVLEREAHAGGCMQSYQRSNIALDTGLHYIGGLREGEPLHEAFKQLDLLDLPWHQLDEDAADIITIAGQTYKLPQGYDRYSQQLTDYFPEEREGIARFVETLKHPTPGMLSLSAYDYLKDTLRNERLIDVVSGAAIKLELRRESLPLFTFVHCNSAYVASSWRLRGSGNLLVDRLVKTITDNGGELLLRAEVVRLETEGKQVVRAICRDGRSFEADRFISDAHPAVTAALLPEADKAAHRLRRRFAMMENTGGMFTASLVVKPETIRYFNHNHYVYNHSPWDFTEQNNPVGGVMLSCRVPEDGSDYAQVIDLLTPMSWAECEPWSGTFIGQRGHAYLQLKQDKARQCIALAEQVLPGLGASIQQCYMSTPLTYRDYTLTPQGSAFGLRKDYRQGMITAVDSRTPYENLRLTGQSLMVHGVEGVTATTNKIINEI